MNEDTVQIIAEDSSSYSTQKKRRVEFKQSWDRTEDIRRSRRSKTSTIDEQVDVIRRIVLDDKRFTAQQMAESRGISSA